MSPSTHTKGLLDLLRGKGASLFIVSFASLLLEVAIIRWIPSEVWVYRYRNSPGKVLILGRGARRERVR